MSDNKDFVIENGVLKKYVGQGGDIVIPKGIVEICSNAFNPYADGISLKQCDGRKNIKSIIIPEGVTKLGDRVFANCEILKKVSFPKSLILLIWIQAKAVMYYRRLQLSFLFLHQNQLMQELQI